MGNNCKYFSGSITSEKLAARIYDRFALQHFGLRAKTNLDYSRAALTQLISEISDFFTKEIDFEVNKSIITLKGIISADELE